MTIARSSVGRRRIAEAFAVDLDQVTVWQPGPDRIAAEVALPGSVHTVVVDRVDQWVEAAVRQLREDVAG